MAMAWQHGVETTVLGLVWLGYDLLKDEVLSQVDPGRLESVLETDVTQHLVLLIQRYMQEYCPFHPFSLLQEFYEFEGREKPPARAKQNDFAFIAFGNTRLAWPFEAKILKTDAALAEYVNEIRSNFVTCRYAPFGSQAGMVGYLLSGSPQRVLAGIAARLECVLTPHPGFPRRDHATSDHDRVVPEGRPYPARIHLHHLILPLACSPPDGPGPKPDTARA